MCCGVRGHAGQPQPDFPASVSQYGSCFGHEPPQISARGADHAAAHGRLGSAGAEPALGPHQRDAHACDRRSSRRDGLYVPGSWLRPCAVHIPSAHSMRHATGWPATIRAGSRSRCCSRAPRTRRPSSSTPTCSSSTTTSPTSSRGSSSNGMISWRCRARPATAPHQLCTCLARTSPSLSTRCTHAAPTLHPLCPRCLCSSLSHPFAHAPQVREINSSRSRRGAMPTPPPPPPPPTQTPCLTAHRIRHRGARHRRHRARHPAVRAQAHQDLVGASGAPPRRARGDSYQAAQPQGAHRPCRHRAALSTDHPLRPLFLSEFC